MSPLLMTIWLDFLLVSPKTVYLLRQKGCFKRLLRIEVSAYLSYVYLWMSLKPTLCSDVFLDAAFKTEATSDIKFFMPVIFWTL